MNKITYCQIFVVMTLLVLSSPLQALDLRGNFVQGGLIIGKTEPTTSVFFQKKKLRVSPEGVFIIGFGRDDPLHASLELRHANNTVEYHTVAIAGRKYNVQRISGLPPEKVDPRSAKVLKRIRKEAAMVRKARQSDAPRTSFAQDFIWPITGKITGVYGSQRILNSKPRQPHYGVDISAPVGAPVKSPADGVVTLVHPDMFFSGGTLIIDHGHGLSSSFLHLHKILVQKWQTVRQGEVIAQVGASGRVTGAHLDWRMNWFDKRIDPALLVPTMQVKTKNTDNRLPDK